MSDINKELDAIQRAGQQSSLASWFKFENVGDSIQGTLVTSYQAKSPAGQDQIVYVLKNDQGSWNVARNVKDERVRRVMDTAKPGQIVRFVFTEIIPHKQKGFNAIKAIDVYTRPDLVDKVWLAENATEASATVPTAPVAEATPAPVAEATSADIAKDAEQAFSGDLPKEA